MKKRFSKILSFDDKFSAKISCRRLLPYFHSFDAYYLQEILRDKRLIPIYCKVYGEALVYLFYGKPCYKSNEDEASSDEAYMPVVFIFKPEYISNIYRLVTFDTGGYPLYAPYMHRKMSRDNFHMTPEPKSILKTISFFYKTAMDYFKGKPKPKEKLKFDPIYFEVTSYLNLIHSAGQNKFDDRKRAIEVQLNCPLELSKDSLAAVIMPANLRNSPLVKKVLIDEIGAQIFTIENYGVPSDHYYTQVLEISKQFMIDNYGL